MSKKICLLQFDVEFDTDVTNVAAVAGELEKALLKGIQATPDLWDRCGDVLVEEFTYDENDLPKKVETRGRKPGSKNKPKEPVPQKEPEPKQTAEPDAVTPTPPTPPQRPSAGPRRIMMPVAGRP